MQKDNSFYFILYFSMNLSVSQIKTFCWSKSKRAGQYILWVKDNYSNDAFPLWHLFEHWILTGNTRLEILKDHILENEEKLLQTFETLKYNSQWLDIPKWELQVMVSGTINNADFVGYIDTLHDGVVYDIKTTQYLTKIDGWKNMRSNMSSYDEYALQMRVYTRLGGYKQGKIIEVSKHEYKDWRNEHQVLEFNRSEERDQEMENKYFPIIDEIVLLHKTLWNHTAKNGK